MRLTRTDRWAIGGVASSWALTPLLCYWLLPAADFGVVGPVTMIGLLLAGAAVFGILWRAARREGAACDARMAAMGFTKERIEPCRVRDYLPIELQRERAQIDGVDLPGSGSGTREVYVRERGDLRTLLYGLWVGSGRRRQYHVVACLESRYWSWPEFTLSPANWADPTALGGAVRVGFEDDPGFSRRWALFAVEEAAVRGLFTEAVRSSLTNLGETRLSASGHRLFLYARNRLLLDGHAAEWLEWAGLLAAGLVANARPQRPLLEVGR